MQAIGEKVRAAADAVTGGRASGSPRVHDQPGAAQAQQTAAGGGLTGGQTTERSGAGYQTTHTHTEKVPVGVVETTQTVQQPVFEERTVAQGGAAVCGQEFFTKTEDRYVVKERVEKVLEHRPVEKEFVVETRATGVERTLPVEVEHLGTTERIVSEAQPKAPCE